MFSFRSWAKNLNVILYRFVSDGTIEYSGFKAVYQFIPNPLETLPFIPKCEFEVGGSTGFIGKHFQQKKKTFMQYMSELWTVIQ